MSSAILYLAIVAIWAVVLVPRWLRPSRNTGTLESNLAEPMDVSAREDAREDLAHEDLAGEDDGGDSKSRPGGRTAGAAAADRRPRVLQARRRTLVTLLVLTGGAVAIAMAHLAADWVVIPPVVMLAGFLLLLREAARADAERARVAASRHRRQQARPARRDPAAPADAKIIDISARVSDQLYDQYADAEVRAVGD